MRTTIIKADGFTVTVRGRTRRTAALESEYTLTLQQAHPDMKDLRTEGGTSEQTAAKNPRGWSLMGVAFQFCRLVARCSEITQDGGATAVEPFAADTLVTLFDIWSVADLPPDKSDLWSRVEAEILKLDTPEVIADPKGERSTSQTLQS